MPTPSIRGTARSDDHQAQHLEDHECHDPGVGRGAETGERLNRELMRVAEQQTVVAGRVPDLLGQHAGEQGTGEPADSVAGEDVERIVDPGAGAELDGEIAGERRHGAEDQGAQRADEARGRA